MHVTCRAVPGLALQVPGQSPTLLYPSRAVPCPRFAVPCHAMARRAIMSRAVPCHMPSCQLFLRVMPCLCRAVPLLCRSVSCHARCQFMGHASFTGCSSITCHIHHSTGLTSLTGPTSITGSPIRPVPRIHRRTHTHHRPTSNTDSPSITGHPPGPSVIGLGCMHVCCMYVRMYVQSQSRQA